MTTMPKTEIKESKPLATITLQRMDAYGQPVLVGTTRRATHCHPRGLSAYVDPFGLKRGVHTGSAITNPNPESGAPDSPKYLGLKAEKGGCGYERASSDIGMVPPVS
jgi:hypothetical protein